MRRVMWVLSFALISGCAAEQAAAPVPTRGPDPRPKMEQIKADCMKQRGFKYIAYVVPDRPEPDLGTYEAMRTYRQKYGFGVFAQLVYPKDPLTGSMESARDASAGDPNEAITQKLNESQLGAYLEAMGGCYAKAAKQVLHKEAGSELEAVGLLQGARDDLEEAEINGDPELVGLVPGFADCLATKGQRVPPAILPTAMAKRGNDAFWDQMKALGDKESKGRPLPDFTPAQARPYLDREIKAALEDLECGKEFYTRFAPKRASIDARVWAEYGPLVGR
ncbi:hypothetical protein [Microtetraspora malaysiensis]|uniref:hypothetical protein n=1 Tax=Microtetraspora malaysiensis TaxID=161358 RepID=UPI000B308A9B|nr:hypothetical protein [Microtetraspora malaysiensis]